MPLFTVASQAGIVTYPPGATFGPRRMGDFEFVWVIEGDTEYTVDGVAHAVPHGGLVLCRPGTVDFFRWDPRRPTRHAFVHFSVERVPAEWPAAGRWPIVREPGPSHVLFELFRQLLRPGGTVEPAVRAAVVGAMLALYVGGAVDAAGIAVPELPDAVRRAWTHLHEALDRDPSAPLDLAQLADVACVTPEHLCRLFKKSLDLTPAKAVLLGRLDRAADLLGRSNLGVAEVADLCGFASAFHFSRRFRDAFGFSPREYRKQIEAGVTPPTPRLLREHLRSHG
jgi:AraC-like DNA-binding protein